MCGDIYSNNMYTNILKIKVAIHYPVINIINYMY